MSKLININPNLLVAIFFCVFAFIIPSIIFMKGLEIIVNDEKSSLNFAAYYGTFFGMIISFSIATAILFRSYNKKSVE
jgi:hypothetical protein